MSVPTSGRTALPRSLEDGGRVATPEDLIVLKLIANRPKDQADLFALAALATIDWAYAERWAGTWGVRDVLSRERLPLSVRALPPMPIRRAGR